MKTPAHPPRQSAIRMKPLARIVAMAIAIYSGNVLAQTVSFPSVPLTVATAVPANLLYIHDDSNSMYWSFMPDEIHRYSMSSPKTSKVPYQLYMSSEFNKTYYDPAFKYAPPPAPPGVSVYDADNRLVTDGTLGNAKFTDAWFNGYDLATRNDHGHYARDDTGTVYRRFNLESDYIPTDNMSMLFGVIPFGRISGNFDTDESTEFLPDAPAGRASYYVCSPSAWKNYPFASSDSNNYDADLCVQRFITTDEEKQNFANWYAYYRTRNQASKAGIGRAFEKLDSSVRVGWGLINKNSSADIDGRNVNTLIEGVRTFDQARKKQFLDWLYKVQPAAMRNEPVFVSSIPRAENEGGSTPLRRALDQAGRYFDRSDSNDRPDGSSNLGPWADDPTRPGTSDTEKAAACRKSFTILMTDGNWNSYPASNPDIADVNVDGNAPFPFRDNYANTLADVAWYYWNKKLVPSSIPNRVPKTPAPEAPDKYRNNAEYQHMTTFTIGLGVAGSVDKNKAFRAIIDPSVNLTAWSEPNPFISSTAKIDDLLHAAVNGHGDFFSAGDPDEFFHGMSSIINSVLSKQKTSSGNLAASTSQPMPILGDVFLYKTHFNPDDWQGDLVAQKINSKTGLEEEVWFASEQMPSPAERNIFTRNSNGNGVSFVWANLDSSHQLALRGASQSLEGQKVLDYIRGSNANEGPDPGQFRSRYRAASNRAPLADSPHNTPVFIKYTGSRKTIFLGANDGMLHAFNADTGTEQFAYIPSMLIPKLAEHTNSHSFFVDGEILVTTPTQTPEQYLLVGALGRGGKGLYGLDVSNPENFQANHVKWELNGLQTCSHSDFDPAGYLGNVIGSLAYAEIDGKPSAIFGNGYNSCYNKAALGVVNILDGSATFIKVSDELDNGLAAPDIKADGTQVSAYAGDLLGRMWKFDLTQNPGTFTRLLDAGVNQPITAKPATATFRVDSGSRKPFVYFGTGRYLSISDKSTVEQQNLYGLVDDGSTLTPGDLERRVFGATSLLGGVPVKAITPLATHTNMNNGWYIPLEVKGERVISTPIIFEGVIIFTTIIPPTDSDPCSPKGSGWLYFVDAKTGNALNYVFLDLNGDGQFDVNDTYGGNNLSGIEIGKLIDGSPGQPKIVNGQLVVCGLDSNNCATFGISSNPPPVITGASLRGRISWREIITN